MFPHIRFFRIPYLGAENLRGRVLYSACRVCGKPLPASSRPFHIQFIQIPVMEEHLRYCNLPVSASAWMQGITGGTFPIVEAAYQVYPRSARSPFAEHPRAIRGAMKSIIKVVIDRLRKRTVT
jgi:hypothetical protein